MDGMHHISRRRGRESRLTPATPPLSSSCSYLVYFLQHDVSGRCSSQENERRWRFRSSASTVATCLKIACFSMHYPQTYPPSVLSALFPFFRAGSVPWYGVRAAPQSPSRSLTPHHQLHRALSHQTINYEAVFSGWILSGEDDVHRDRRGVHFRTTYSTKTYDTPQIHQ